MAEKPRVDSRGLRKNPPLLCVFHGLQMTLFPMAIITLFWQRDIGLSLSELMLLPALFGLVVAVFEFPSGYVADRIGYRAALILASVAAIAGSAVQAAAMSFWQLVIAEALLGLALSLVSGADSALLYESLLELDDQENFGRWFGRTRFFGQVAEGSAALLTGVLYASWHRLPLILQIGVWILNLGVALALREPERHRPAVGNHLAHARGILFQVLRDHRRLRAVMALAICLSLSSFVPVWIIQPYAIDAGMPVAWLGPFWAAANYSVALGALASSRFGQALGFMPALLGCIALAALGYLGLSLSSAIWGVGFYLLITLVRGLWGPILHQEEQRLIPSADRSSFVSVRSLLFRVVFLTLGPGVGFAIEVYGMHITLFALGAGLLLAELASWLALRGISEAE